MCTPTNVLQGKNCLRPPAHFLVFFSPCLPMLHICTVRCLWSDIFVLQGCCKAGLETPLLQSSQSLLWTKAGPHGEHSATLKPDPVKQLPQLCSQALSHPFSLPFVGQVMHQEWHSSPSTSSVKIFLLFYDYCLGLNHQQTKCRGTSERHSTFTF